MLWGNKRKSHSGNMTDSGRLYSFVYIENDTLDMNWMPIINKKSMVKSSISPKCLINYSMITDRENVFGNEFKNVVMDILLYSNKKFSDVNRFITIRGDWVVTLFWLAIVLVEPLVPWDLIHFTPPLRSEYELS